MSQPRVPLEADDLLDNLLEMESLLQFTTPDGRWHARAKGCNHHASGRTPAEAMERALALRTNEQRT